MKKLLALLLLAPSLAALAVPAFAGTVTVSWTNPTTYTDGSTLPASAITRTRIEYGTCNGAAFGTKAGEFVATGSATSVVSPNIAAGTYCFRAATSVGTTEGAFSNVAQATIAPPTPGAPSGLQVVVLVADTNAYKLRQAVDGFSMVAFGTVPAGTVCDATQSVGGYALIPRAAVVPRSRFEPLPLMAFARCG